MCVGATNINNILTMLTKAMSRCQHLTNSFALFDESPFFPVLQFGLVHHQDHHHHADHRCIINCYLPNKYIHFYHSYTTTGLLSKFLNDTIFQSPIYTRSNGVLSYNLSNDFFFVYVNKANHPERKKLLCVNGIKLSNTSR